MFRVQFKQSNAGQAWSVHGSYSENAALLVAALIAGRYFMVRVIDPRGYVVWSA